MHPQRGISLCQLSHCTTSMLTHSGARQLEGRRNVSIADRCQENKCVSTFVEVSPFAITLSIFIGKTEYVKVAQFFMSLVTKHFDATTGCMITCMYLEIACLLEL